MRNYFLIELTAKWKGYSFAIRFLEATMAKARSPGYPTIGLPEAIEKIKAVYAKDYQNKITREVAAEHMGYRSLNGKSLGVLSAVAKFGLLEGRGDDNRVSDLALAIIAHPPGTPERARAIVEAAGRPELFAELDDRFPGGKASEPTIRAFLMTQKFIPQAADMAIRSYRETKALVNEESGAYSGDGSSQSSQDENTMAPVGADSPHARKGSTAPGGAVITLPGEREFLRGPLSRDAAYRLVVSGEIGAKELAKIIKVLTLQKELLMESEAEDDGGPE
jgi:hypothetical protein